jgi:DNA polymerase-4
LDEAYLDVTHNLDFSGSATLIAKDIKQRIKQVTNLTASAGVSYNKFLAKLASDMDKPDGIYLITPEQGPDFIKQLPIRKFHGIGQATEVKMKAFGIHTGNDLLQKDMHELQQRFGKVGRFYYNIARGIDERPVNNHRERKSLGKETTFSQDINNQAQMHDILSALSESVAKDLFEKGLYGQTVTLKVKYADFELITRSITLDKPTRSNKTIYKTARALMLKTEAGTRAVRLLGVSLSKLSEQSVLKEKEASQIDLI